MRDLKRLAREKIAPLGMEATAEAELVEELAQHLEDKYREMVSGGASEDDAYRTTAAELDDVAGMRAEMERKQLMPKHEAAQAGDAKTGRFLDDLGRDLRYTFRNMGKTPAFVLFVVLTLALGIGANTTVFTIVNTLILNPLPVPDASGLAAVEMAQAKGTSRSAVVLPLSYANLRDYQGKNEVFESLAGYTSPQIVTLDANGGPQRMFAEFVTGNYFATLGLRPAMGRFFSPEEDSTPGGHAVAVMNYATWQARFGGGADIVGKTLRLNGLVFTVIGVAPRQYRGVNAMFGPDVWLPAAMVEAALPGEMKAALSDRAKGEFKGVGRLKPGVSRAQAQADMAAVAAALAREYPEANERRTATVRPIADVLFGDDNSSNGRTPILFGSAVLLVVAGIILLIACSNVANLLLARSAAREQEMAVRLAMGASRGRLIRQLLTESVVLGAAGGVAGLAMGYAGTQLLWSFRPAAVAANMVTPKLDAGVFVFTLIVSLAMGLVFGVIPALRASRTSVAESLKEEARTAGRNRRKVTLANVLLVGQVAFSFVSLMTAALFLRSIDRAYEIDPGFDAKHLAVFMTNPGQAGFGKSQTKAFYKEVRERVAALPGVESVSWSLNMPFWGRIASGVDVEGRERSSKADVVTTVLNTVDLGYFETAGVAIDRGRAFTEMDQEGSTQVAIVNEKMARDWWPGREALGKRIQLPGETKMRQIVGVARNANYSTLGEPAQACVYVPLEQSYFDAMTLYVRSKGDPEGILAPVQREVRRAAPRILVDDVRTGRKVVDDALFGAKAGVAMLSAFGALALALASAGLYGIMAYSVSRRRREIGVRMALGAARGSVLGMILKQGMTLVGTGVAIGLAAALIVGRLLARMLYGTGASDPLSVAGAAAVLFAVALAACYLPARRASRVDPVEVLREG